MEGRAFGVDRKGWRGELSEWIRKWGQALEVGQKVCVWKGGGKALVTDNKKREKMSFDLVAYYNIPLFATVIKIQLFLTFCHPHQLLQPCNIIEFNKPHLFCRHSIKTITGIIRSMCIICIYANLFMTQIKVINKRTFIVNIVS